MSNKVPSKKKGDKPLKSRNPRDKATPSASEFVSKQEYDFLDLKVQYLEKELSFLKSLILKTSEPLPERRSQGIRPEVLRTSEPLPESKSQVIRSDVQQKEEALKVASGELNLGSGQTRRTRGRKLRKEFKSCPSSEMDKRKDILTKFSSFIAHWGLENFNDTSPLKDLVLYSSELTLLLELLGLSDDESERERSLKLLGCTILEEKDTALEASSEDSPNDSQRIESKSGD